MTYKRIVAAADGGDGDAETLAAAAHLGAEHGAVVAVVPVFPDISADLMSVGVGIGGFLSPSTVGLLQDVEREAEARVRATCAAAAASVGMPFGEAGPAPRLVLIDRQVRPGPAIASELVLADLMVLSYRSASASPHGRDILGDALLNARSAVLLSRGDPGVMLESAVICWDGSPQAGRAVRASLPLLRRSRRVTLLQSPHGLDWPNKIGADFERLIAYLTLHGLTTIEHKVVGDGREGPALVAEAERQGATLLVAGAYGHSRLRQTIFGGATRAFLDADTGPLLHLLLAH